MRFAAIVMVLFSALPAAAQNLQFSPVATEVCIQSANDIWQQKSCIGRSAQQCMDATSDGGTTVGMGGCLNYELEYWDAALNRTYKAVMSKAKALDAENATISDNIPKLAGPLRDMQRAWIPFRDAACDFDMAQWGGGSGGGSALLACLMRVTGEQTLDLNAMWLGE